MAFSRAGFPRALKRLYDQLDALMTPKSASQTVTASTVLVDMAEMRFAMLPNTTYRFRAVVFFDTSAAGDFKWRHVGPAAPTRVRVARRSIVPGATALGSIAVDVAYSGADIAEAGAGTDGGFVEIEGVIENGVNAGDFKLQYAQNASDAGATIVRKGSYISSTQV